MKKLIVIHQPWIEPPYVVCLDAGSGEPKPYGGRFDTEEAARNWCEQRVKGAQKVAEFELP